jgi:3-oxoacyl-[acyl-carrier-protein] synthase II
MGEEQAGVDALRIARERIAAGQADIVLVGGAYNAERPDVLLIYEMGGFLWKKPFRPCSSVRRPGGFVLGSAAAFILLEAEDHAAARGARGIAELPRAPPGAPGGSLATSRPRSGGSGTEAGARPDALVLSGATGVAGITTEERDALAALSPGSTPRATGDCLGHAMEAQAPAGAVMAAALVARGDAAEAVVTSVGHRRGEGVLRLTKWG